MKPTVETQQGAWSLPYDLTASPEDLQLTGRLKDAGDLLAIDVLDHVIVGDGTFSSLRESGQM